MPRPPKFDSRHRHPKVGPLTLPSEGRSGPAPSWPLDVKATKQELEGWKALWATPHATAWESLGWTRTVARYCRAMVAAEVPGASPALLAQVTALEDRLGLTPKAMRLLLWRMSEETVESSEQPNVLDVRERLRAVD